MPYANGDIYRYYVVDKIKKIEHIRYMNKKLLEQQAGVSRDIFSDEQSESQSKLDCQPVRRRSWSSATTAAEAEENVLFVSRMST